MAFASLIDAAFYPLSNNKLWNTFSCGVQNDKVIVAGDRLMQPPFSSTICHIYLFRILNNSPVKACAVTMGFCVVQKKLHRTFQKIRFEHMTYFFPRTQNLRTIYEQSHSEARKTWSHYKIRKQIMFQT